LKLTEIRRAVSGYDEVVVNLKGPKHEKFVAGIFIQIRPVWIGELETRPKTKKVVLDCFFIHFNRPRRLFLILNFYSV
jgi:hypothetical protein